MKKSQLYGFCIILLAICGLTLRFWLGSIHQETIFTNSGSKNRQGLDKKADSQLAVTQYHSLVYEANNPGINETYFKSEHTNPKNTTKKNEPETQKRDISNLSAEPIWQQWKSLLEQSDFQQIPLLTATLSQSLQQNPDPHIYDAIVTMLWQTDISSDKKALILDLLSEIATPESLKQLLTLTEHGIESDLYLQVLQAISRIGDNHWQGRYHSELAPVLLTAWTDSNNHDSAFYNAVGKAIAGVGDSQGINELLLALSTQGNGKQSEEIGMIKRQVAFKVIPQIRNPDAVEILGSWFAQESIGAPAFEASGTALAEIGSPEATQKILDWARTAPSEGIRNLQDWLAKIDDPSALQQVAATETTQVFRSPEVEAVVNQYVNNPTAVTLQPSPGNVGITSTTIDNASSVVGQ